MWQPPACVESGVHSGRTVDTRRCAAISVSAGLVTHPRVDDWIRRDTPQRITVRTGKVEIGQGINTALIMTAAAELSVDPAFIQLDAVITSDASDEGMTSGSNSIE
jgi:nicotinate dehydrogenase subunit B